MQTEVVLSKAAAATFELFEIDRRYIRYDDVEVYGMCGNAIIKPKMSYVTSPSKSSYKITGNKAAAINKTSSYTNVRGRLHVEFEDAVEKIYIKHKYTAARPVTGRKRIGIGPMEFTCPAPLPPPTAEGIIFTKQGSTDVFLCEEVEYTFRIYNTGCDPYPVNFSDVLPAGMTWVPESLSIDEEKVEGATNAYEGTDKLTIEGILVPGGSKPFTFRARAKFDDNAVEGDYGNRAYLNYQSVTGLGVTQKSCDRLTPGCEGTVTHALASERPKPVTTSIVADKSCFVKDGKLRFTLKINNPNNVAIPNAILEFAMNEDFKYDLNSLISSSGIPISAASITYEDGSLTVEDFSIPKGEHSISFTLNVPSTFTFLTGELLALPLDLSYSLESETDDICLGSALNYSNGELEIPVCTTCTQKPTGGVSDPSKVGISAFKNQIKGWPENVPNGYLVLESHQKGMVLSRVNVDDIPTDKLVEGMIVFDLKDKCIKMYNGTGWNCIERACNE